MGDTNRITDEQLQFIIDCCRIARASGLGERPATFVEIARYFRWRFPGAEFHAADLERRLNELHPHGYQSPAPSPSQGTGQPSSQSDQQREPNITPQSQHDSPSQPLPADQQPQPSKASQPQPSKASQPQPSKASQPQPSKASQPQPSKASQKQPSKASQRQPSKASRQQSGGLHQHPQDQLPPGKVPDIQTVAPIQEPLHDPRTLVRYGIESGGLPRLLSPTPYPQSHQQRQPAQAPDSLFPPRHGVQSGGLLQPPYPRSDQQQRPTGAPHLQFSPGHGVQSGSLARPPYPQAYQQRRATYPQAYQQQQPTQAPQPQHYSPYQPPARDQQSQCSTAPQLQGGSPYWVQNPQTQAMGMNWNLTSGAASAYTMNERAGGDANYMNASNPSRPIPEATSTAPGYGPDEFTRTQAVSHFPFLDYQSCPNYQPLGKRSHSIDTDNTPPIASNDAAPHRLDSRKRARTDNSVTVTGPPPALPISSDPNHMYSVHRGEPSSFMPWGTIDPSSSAFHGIAGPGGPALYSITGDHGSSRPTFSPAPGPPLRPTLADWNAGRFSSLRAFWEYDDQMEALARARAGAAESEYSYGPQPFTVPPNASLSPTIRDKNGMEEGGNDVMGEEDENGV
ncbi:hypothetical protein F4777DRAFT_575446 [Nemania sp. FL0916]|nr:hypothetical protein F4777DRAFT_575446 [Nemania sp. FL0916]